MELSIFVCLDGGLCSETDGMRVGIDREMKHSDHDDFITDFLYMVFLFSPVIGMAVGAFGYKIATNQIVLCPSDNTIVIAILATFVPIVILILLLVAIFKIAYRIHKRK